ncbi:MAG: molecular chaperone DnaJ [Desulfovibrio sp.]|nr:MAG: molecular chaperone DnaJ [Desulfovibrio sp.]
MNLREGYRILRLDQGADLDEVKKAYRQMAFALHPDLNPDDPHAAKHFQRINEAYVLLKDHLQAEPPPSREQRRADRASAKERQARERQAEPPGAGPSARREARQERSGQTSGASRRPGRKPTQEEVLKDILGDPFARQVFEDIYASIRKSGGKAANPGTTTSRDLRVGWGDKETRFDLTHGIAKGVKSWVKGWLDDEQTVEVAPSVLRSGAKLRLQVDRGWSGKSRSVDVTLPSDYVIGRPLRLKGLGRKFGPWKGDLYVRLVIKQ